MRRHLKIAMISLHSCPLGKLGGRDTGGMNVYIQELALELGRRGHTVDIYTKVHHPQHEQLVNLGENVRLIHLETADDKKIPKIALYSYLQRFTRDIEDFRKSARIHYDLLHSHYWLSGLAGKELQTWWHIPHVTMFHTLGAIKNSLGIGEYEPELRIESELLVAANCERIVAATERERNDLVQHYSAPPEKVVIIPCGVNLKLFRPIGKQIARKELKLDGEKVILFVGRIEPLKGLDQLLRALTYFKNGASPRLVIVGGDEDSQDHVHALETMARELKIENSVSFVGSVAQDRLPLFYSAADICVIPSYYESFGMVALESLACGTPIVSTDVGAVRNIMPRGEMGRIVSDNSPNKLAHEVSALLLSQEENSALQIEMRRSAIAEFSWVNITNMMLREYNRLLNDHPSEEHLEFSHTTQSHRKAESPKNHIL